MNHNGGTTVNQEPPELVAMKRALGRQLAALRETAEICQQQVVRKTGYSRSSVAKAEAGRQLLTREFWKTVDEFLQAHGALLASYEEVQAAKQEYERQSREAELAEAYAAARALRSSAVSSPMTLLPLNTNAVVSPWGVVSEANHASVEPIDEAFISSIRTRMQELLALDAQVL